MCSTAILCDHDSHRDFRVTFALLQSLCLIVDHIDDSPSFLHKSTKLVRIQQITITTSIHPVTVEPNALYPSIHVSCTAPECTAISLAVARFASVTAAKAREAREMY